MDEWMSGWLGGCITGQKKEIEKEGREGWKRGGRGKEKSSHSPLNDMQEGREEEKSAVEGKKTSFSPDTKYRKEKKE